MASQVDDIIEMFLRVNPEGTVKDFLHLMNLDPKRREFELKGLKIKAAAYEFERSAAYPKKRKTGN